MTDQLQKDMLNLLTDWHNKQNKHLEYLLRMVSEHPTYAGRKKAMVQHNDLNNRIWDVLNSWKDINVALFPKTKRETNA
jgi:hypothetical protein